MAYRVYQDLVMVLHTPVDPDDKGWSNYLSMLDSLSTSHHPNILVFTMGGSPSHLQCEQLMERLTSSAFKGLRLALMSDDATPHMILQHIAPMAESSQSFGVDGLDDALAFLQVEDADQVRLEFDALCLLFGFTYEAAIEFF